MRRIRLLCPLIGSIAIISILCSVVAPSAAALSETQPYLVAQGDSGITFYSVDADGTPQALKTLTEFRLGQPEDSTHWWIRDAFHAAANANRSTLSWTGQRGQQRALFIDRLNGEPPEEIALPYLLEPTWSPDGSAILLAPGGRWYDDSLDQNSATYVYTLSSGQLQQVSHSDETDSDYRWLPDSSGFTYLGPSEPCSDCSGTQEDLWTSDRQGEHARRLTRLDHEAPPDTLHTICDVTWSDILQRFYFIVGCDYGDPSSPYQYLYSTSFAGDTRREYADMLGSMFPNTYLSDLTGLFSLSTGSPIRLILQTFADTNDGHGAWQVVGIDQTGLTGERDSLPVYGLVDGGPAFLAPDGQTLALTGYQDVAQTPGAPVIYFADMNSGHFIGEQPVITAGFCDALWQDNQTLLYTVVPEGRCDIERADAAIWLTTISGETVNISASLSGRVGLIH